jgi:hypothetical protein
MMYRDGRTLQARIDAIARMAVEMHRQALEQQSRGESPPLADDRRRRPAGGTGQEGQG